MSILLRKAEGVRFKPRRGVKGGKKILKHVLGPNLKFCGLEGKIHAKMGSAWGQHGFGDQLITNFPSP